MCVSEACVDILGYESFQAYHRIHRGEHVYYNKIVSCILFIDVLIPPIPYLLFYVFFLSKCILLDFEIFPFSFCDYWYY